MSEYQYVAFRAIDRPVSAKNLEFMHRQSSRAEITPWSFENEYQYGDFRGDAVEMLRRGYDIHLHYANFGIRKLLIRLPQGLSNAKAAKPFLGKHSVRVLNDKQGPGAILAIEPFHEPGDLDELWDVGARVDRLVPLRAEILDGDLRPLYIAHLAVSCDGEHDPEETLEAPVAAGLETPSDAQRELAELYCLGGALIAAAAQHSPPMPSAGVNTSDQYVQWLCGQQASKKDAWLAALMTDPTSAMRSDILAAYRTERGLPVWPTAQPTRTIAQLYALAADIARDVHRKTAEKAARQRAKRLAKMAKDPAATLRETEQMVSERTTHAYSRIADLLADLREALSKTDRSKLAEEHAQKLKAANPKLHLLTKELRRKGLVAK